MRLRILPATVDRTPGQSLSGYVVDDCLAIDAGSLGFSGSIEEQSKIEHILLTHSHIDHLAGLPMLLDNLYGTSACCPTVYGIRATLDSLQSDLFNDRLMPDFIGMSKRMAPFLSLQQIEPDQPFTIGKYTITAMPVLHTVPTVGYIVDDGMTALGLFTDTRPIPAVLKSLIAHPRLTAVFLECSFPRRMHELAELSGHLSTDEFLELARLLPGHVGIFPIHIKPRFYHEIIAELGEAKLPNLRIVEPGNTIEI